MKRTIYHIEDRAHYYIYHWIFYMINGLQYIQNNLDNKPCYIYFPYIETFLDYQKESLEIIKNDFKVVLKEEITTDDIIINNYGESNTKEMDYTFIKNLFLPNINKTLLDKNKFNYKNIYIRRSRSHLCEGNKNENFIKRRHILNEDELCCVLSTLNIHCIYLEDFNFIDKINIFSNAEIIISPNSGALSMLIFTNKNTHVVEINTQNPHQVFMQYESICKFFYITYNRYTNVIKVDSLDNMKIDINHFLNYIQNLNINI